MFACLLRKLREAKRDGGFDLLGEVEVLPRDVREKRVDQVQASQFGAGRRTHGLVRSSDSISSINSEASRNCL